jgi:hypothetical protein
MTNKFHVLDHPMLLYAGHTTTGHTKDLKAGIIGLFDDKNGTAVTATTIKGNKPVRFAQGSYHSKDNLGLFYRGLRNSLKTADFLPKDVMHIEFSPFALSQNEKWIFGWDGINDCETLKFECGKTHKFRVRIFGEGVYNEFTKQILRDVSVTTACCDSDECAEGCPDNSIHCRNYTKALVKAINSDVEISKFVKAEVVYPEIAAKVLTHKKMCLSVCDNGDQEALSAIQRAYPSLTITRTGRVGSTSTYQTNCILNATSVSNYTPSTDVLLSVCNTCQAGFTLVNGKDVYTIVRNIADYTNTADVIADYVAASVATIPTTDVTIGTDTITENAHKFVTGQAVTYSNGGGTTLAGLTNGTVYYVIKTGVNSFKVATTAANAFAGTAIDLTGTGNNAQTFTPVFTATEIAHTPTTVVLQLVVDAGAAVAAVDAGAGIDAVTKGASIPSVCSPSAPSAIAWTQCASGHVATRTLTAIISKDCNGSSNRLAEIQAYYSTDHTITGVTLLEAGACEDKYQITQQSECMGPDGCLTEELPVYANIGSFEGVMWGEDPCVEPATPAEQNLCGIRLEVSSSYDRFGNCSWVPEDYYTFKPTMMEIWEVEEDGAPCKKQVTARKLQNAEQARQSGEWVAREYINLAAYLYHSAFESDPRLREILDQTIYQIVDKKAFYNVFYIKYKQYRGSNFEGNMQNAETYEIPIVLKEGIDVTPFINYLNSMFGPMGIMVQPRIGQPNY